MIARKILITAALLLGATSAAFAQSAWTTGSAADRERAGYGSSSGHVLYDYAPGFVARQSGGIAAGNPYSPAATGGGSTGYNWMIEHNY
jgi:hypothetical protein